MAARSLTDFRVPQIAPLANSIRTLGGRSDPKTAEALDMIGRQMNLIAEAIRALAAVRTSVVPTVNAAIFTPDVIVLTTGAQTITSPIPIVNGAVMVLRLRQAGSPGGGIIAFSSSDFWPTPQEISPDPDTVTTYLFAGIADKWFFLSVANPL